MAKKKVDANELNWIQYITGAHNVTHLTPRNVARLRIERMDRVKCIKSGRIPRKPYPSGIVGVDEED